MPYRKEEEEKRLDLVGSTQHAIVSIPPIEHMPNKILKSINTLTKRIGTKHAQNKTKEIWLGYIHPAPHSQYPPSPL